MNQRVCILRPLRIYPRFLVYVADRHPELLAHDDGFNQTHLPNAAFKTMHLPLPPLKEQIEIAKFVALECMVREATTSRTEREIDLLREFRTRLIADVVTGKLDVREAAACLPDEVSNVGAADAAEAPADEDAAESEEMDDTAIEEAEV